MIERVIIVVVLVVLLRICGRTVFCPCFVSCLVKSSESSESFLSPRGLSIQPELGMTTEHESGEVPLRRTADNLMQPWSLDPAAQELEGNPTVGADSPCMGIVFNWDQSLVESVRAAEVAREYMKYEYLTLRRPMNWLHPACVAMNVFERQLRTFLNDALEGQEVPLAIPIPTPEGWYEARGTTCVC